MESSSEAEKCAHKFSGPTPAETDAPDEGTLMTQRKKE